MPARPHRTYSEAEKGEAVGRAIAVGAERASAEMNIPRRTIDQWKSSPAFAEMRLRARDDVAAELWAGVQIAISAVIDGLQSPKAPLRDKAQALGVLYDRYALLTGSATSRSENRDITGSLTDAELDAAIAEAQALVRGEAGPPDRGTAQAIEGD